MLVDDKLFPRRNRVDLLTEPELAIRAAIHAVENGRADQRMTAALLKLQEAQNLVADVVDDELAKFQVGLIGTPEFHVLREPFEVATESGAASALLIKL